MIPTLAAISSCLPGGEPAWWCSYAKGPILALAAGLLQHGGQISVHFAKNPAPQLFLLLLLRVGGSPVVAADALELRIVLAGRGKKLGQRSRTLVGNAVAPALGVAKQGLLRAIVPRKRVQRSLYRRRVGVAHELADQLLLPPQRPMGAHALRLAHGLQQLRLERDIRELGGAQADQSFPEFLQREISSFLRALAGLCIGHQLSYAAPQGRRWRTVDHGVIESVWQGKIKNMASAKRNAPERQKLEDIVQLMLREARQLGADQAEAAASHDIGLSVTARLGEVENLEYTNDRGVGITVYRNSCKGSASTSDFRVEALREAVRKACSIATFTAADEFAGLADADLMAREVPDLGLAHPWPLESEEAIRLAIECEDAARSYDQRITNSEGATVASSGGVRAYGNSHEFLGSYEKTSHSISCVVIGEAGGEMQRDYHYSATRDAADLEAVTAIGEQAARRTVGRLGARKIKTTAAPVLLAPEVARGFIGHAIAAVSGGAQYRKASFLLGASGEQLFPEFMRIEERPHIPKALASAPYDAEGVATRDRDLVADGVLQGYVLSSYSARRLGLQSTGNAGGAHNLIVPGSGGDLQSLLQQMQCGLLVHELIGHGVNAVTGDYSRGAAGYWIENGEIAYPVHEVTIAGNLKDLYRRISALGNDLDLRGGIRCGSLLIEEMAIAGA